MVDLTAVLMVTLSVLDGLDAFPVVKPTIPMH